MFIQKYLYRAVEITMTTFQEPKELLLFILFMALIILYDCQVPLSLHLSKENSSLSRTSLEIKFLFLATSW